MNAEFAKDPGKPVAKILSRIATRFPKNRVTKFLKKPACELEMKTRPKKGKKYNYTKDCKEQPKEICDQVVKRWRPVPRRLRSTATPRTPRSSPERSALTILRRPMLSLEGSFPTSSPSHLKRRLPFRTKEDLRGGD